MQTPDTLARPENPNPKWPVPKDLIELQPSYKQVGKAYSSFTTIFYMYFRILLQNDVLLQDNWDPDWQSTSSSKVAYLIRSLKELQDANSEVHQPKDDGADVQNIQGLLCASWTRNSNVNTHKVLVFSQFLEHIHVIEQQVIIANQKTCGPLWILSISSSLTLSICPANHCRYQICWIV